MLFLVSSLVNHINRTEDPWFSATKLNDDGTYASDDAVSVIGCATQREYCNPNRPHSSGCIQEFQPITNQESDLRTAWEGAEDRKYLRPLAMTLHQFGA